MTAEKTRIPKSIGIILDGNRRFARSNNMAVIEGHVAGYQKVKEILSWAFDAGIETVYLYSFSTENWNRPPEEVSSLMKLFRWVLTSEVDELHKNGARIKIFGERERFSAGLQKLMQEAEEKTAENSKGTIAILLSYGGRREIVEAARCLIREGVPADAVTEEILEQRLWTYPLPSPDIIIRTGGEMRLSNFLTWQSAYSEFFFPKSFLPDFSREEFDSILADFASRDRRYGK